MSRVSFINTSTVSGNSVSTIDDLFLISLGRTFYDVFVKDLSNILKLSFVFILFVVFSTGGSSAFVSHPKDKKLS